MPLRPQLSLPTPGSRRAIVVGAGSFGTAVAVLLARGGFKTTLQTRSAEQAARLEADRENKAYLPEVALPRELRVEPMSAGLSRADYVFLGVPSKGIAQVIENLHKSGLPARTPVISMAKGLVPPDGLSPTTLLNQVCGVDRVGCLGGPAHAREMVTAGAAAGHIFAEVWRYADRQGGKPESMIGLAGTGDLVGTALAPQSRNRRAGELLGQGVPAAEIPARIGQAVESLDMVPLLATALRRAHVDAPVTTALHGLISGELPLDEWVAKVRTTVPPPAARDSVWKRTVARVRRRQVRDSVRRP